MLLVALNSQEIRLLLSGKYQEESAENDTYRWVCASDLFKEVENLKIDVGDAKKRDILKHIIDRNSQLYIAITTGYVNIFELDKEALSRGLFLDDEPSEDCDLWKEVLNSDVRPDYSMRMISARRYNLYWGTNLCDELEEIFGK